MGLKTKTWDQPTYAEGLDDTPPCWAPHHVILRVQRPDGDMKVLLIVR